MLSPRDRKKAYDAIGDSSYPSHIVHRMVNRCTLTPPKNLTGVQLHDWLDEHVDPYENGPDEHVEWFSTYRQNCPRVEYHGLHYPVYK